MGIKCRITKLSLSNEDLIWMLVYCIVRVQDSVELWQPTFIFIFEYIQDRIFSPSLEDNMQPPPDAVRVSPSLPSGEVLETMFRVVLLQVTPVGTLPHVDPR